MLISDFRLTPNQRETVDAALKQKVTAIKGRAGSGKTLVASTIATELAESSSNQTRGQKLPIYLLTYTNALVSYTRNNLKVDNVEVKTVHLALQEFLKSFGVTVNFGNNKKHFLKQKLDQDRYDIDFVIAEFRFIYGNGFLTKEAYLNAEQSSRDIRETDLEYIFNLFEEYQESLRQIGVNDFNDIGNIVLEFCANNDYQPVCEHLIIDETQDLPITQIKALQKIVKNKIVYIGDVAQSIYGSGFSWKNSIGDDIKPYDLKINFRNTQQIYDAADSILKFEYDLAPEKINEFSLEGSSIQTEANRPQVFFCRDEQQMKDNLLMKLQELFKDKEELEVGIGYRRSKSLIFLESLEDELDKLNIKLDSAREPDYSLKRVVRYSTFHSMKGLEFNHSILIDLDDDIFFEETDKIKSEKEEIERRLLFVAITRAKESLTLFSTGDTPLRYISEISPSKILPVVWNPKSYENTYSEQLNRIEEARSIIRKEYSLLNQKIADLEDQLESNKFLSQKDQQILNLEKKLKEAELAQNDLENKLHFYSEEKNTTQKILDYQETEFTFRQDAKIVLLGGDGGVKEKDLGGIFKSVGLSKDSFIHISYEEIKNHDINNYMNTDNYSDIFIGASPHKARGIGNSSSLKQYLLENQEFFPKVTVFADDKGELMKFSKTKLRQHLRGSNLYAAKNGL